MDEIEELKQFKNKFEKEEKRKKLNNKIGYLISTLIFVIVFFYSSNLLKSTISGLGDLFFIPQMILIFNILGIIFAIIFIILLSYLIFSKIKEKKAIQP